MWSRSRRKKKEKRRWKKETGLLCLMRADIVVGLGRWYIFVVFLGEGGGDPGNICIEQGLVFSYGLWFRLNAECSVWAL